MRWPSVKTAMEVVALGVAIPTALVASVALVPQAWRVTHERDAEYAVLRHLHAGYSVQYITARMGTPTIVTRIANDPSVTKELLFIKREYVVSVLTDRAGSAVSYAVFACNHDFQPSFVSPAGQEFRLNATPLASTYIDGRPGASTGPNHRYMFYGQDATASSVGQLVEVGADSGSNAVGGRSYMLGVNAACGASVNFGQFEVPVVIADFSGADRRAFDRFRRTAEPNFYFESVRPNARVDEFECLILEPFDGRGNARDDARLESETGGCLGASALRSRLPEEFKDAESPAFFRNLWG